MHINNHKQDKIDNPIFNNNVILLEKHSNECINANFRNLPDVKLVLKEHEEFLIKVHNYLDSITFCDKKQIKHNIRKIYLDNEYKFDLEKDEINKIIMKFKNNSIKFTKQYIFIKNKDSKGNDFLRDYSYFLTEYKNPKNRTVSEYAIWSTDNMIAHMRESNYFFIDATWYKPPNMFKYL